MLHGTRESSNRRQLSHELQDFLTHVVNHGTYHRGQLSSMIRQLGVAPPLTDFVFVQLDVHLSPTFIRKIRSKCRRWGCNNQRFLNRSTDHAKAHRIRNRIPRRIFRRPKWRPQLGPQER
ncbi:MAG: DinB family protein [Gemmatimonadaceae bacterium]